MHDHVKTIFCNGISNTFNNARTSAQQISNFLDHPVDFCYNNGPNDLMFGTTTAIAGAALSLLSATPLPLILTGLGSRSLVELRKEDCAAIMAKKIRSSLQEHWLNRVVLILHSQGRDIGEKALHKLSTNEKNRITVLTLGSSPIAEKSAGKVINLQQNGDLIPTLMGFRDGVMRLLTLNFSKSKRRVHVIDGNEHSLASYLSHPTVQDHLRREFHHCIHQIAEQTLFTDGCMSPLENWHAV